MIRCWGVLFCKSFLQDGTAVLIKKVVLHYEGFTDILIKCRSYNYSKALFKNIEKFNSVQKKERQSERHEN